ncbi:MAG: DUF1801 domain-containing protein [Eubacteriales bacterium]
MNTDSRKEINTYLEQKPENLQKIAASLVEIILLSHYDMEAAIKWSKPTFAINNDFHHWICAVQVMKNKVALVFHFGGLLNDEKNILIAGASRFLRKMEYERLDNINEVEIKCYIQLAIEKLPYFIENWKELNKKE